MADWSIWCLEYAQCLAQPRSSVIYGGPKQETQPFSYGFVYIEDGHSNVLIDAGFAEGGYGEKLGAENGVTNYAPASEVLGRIGRSPSDIDAVILTHAHYDHAGGLERFPHSKIFCPERELRHWQAAVDASASITTDLTAVNPEDIDYLSYLESTGRLTLLPDSQREISKGLTAVPAHGSHTPGSQYIVITNPDGAWVAAGDNLFSYENAGGYEGSGPISPIGFNQGSAQRNREAIAEIMGIARTLHRVAIVHEPEMYERHRSFRTDQGLGVAELCRRRIEDVTMHSEA